jgi:hypothetical protein
MSRLDDYPQGILDMVKGCLTCSHLHNTYPATCDAFTGGIPLPILAGDVPHDKPIQGDNGIQYEADEEKVLKELSYYPTPPAKG